MSVLAHWEPEDADFWSSTGSRVASRNLWLSTGCLMVAFAVWMVWSVVTVQMQALGFPFTKEQLYSLTAIAGLAGATLRIPQSFILALAGGRVVVAVTTALLLLPAVGLAVALRSPETPFAVFATLAALSGLGGGNFASSMANISLFFPKRKQGMALGINAGLGNLGLSIMQVALPLATGIGLFGALGGPPLQTAAGKSLWLQNAGLLWVAPVGLLALMAWLAMNSLPVHAAAAGSSLRAVGQVLHLTVLGLLGTALGVALLLTGQGPWLVLPLTVAVTMGLLTFASPRAARESLGRQYAIFRNKHTWIMTALYVMTFGSFIGYTAAFPKLIQDVFGVLPGGAPNPHAPSPFAYVWLGPLVGSLMRTAGGWLADRWGGARVTQWSTAALLGVAVMAGRTVYVARLAPAPEVYFPVFLVLFLALFVLTGLGNGSTFRMVPSLFPPLEAAPVLGWISAVAAYGAFVIPQVFGAQIKQGHPEFALYGFAAYYFTCLALNGWCYVRRGAGASC